MSGTGSRSRTLHAPIRSLRSAVLAGAVALSAFALTIPAAAGGPAESPGVVRLERSASGTVRLELDARFGASWREVNVGRLVVRADGGQRRVPARSLPASGTLALATSATSCSLILADLGPASERGLPDAWNRVTRSAKVVTCPSASAPGAFEARVRAAGILTTHTASRIEIRPLLNPLTVRPGSDLPVRLYFEGGAAARARVTAIGPGGARHDAFADADGFATLRIPSAGRWTIELRPRGSESEAILVFDVEPKSFWRRARPAAPVTAKVEAMTSAASFHSARWRSLGPSPIGDVEYAGRIAAFAADPARRNRYVAGGASGGIWVTHSGGTSWRSVGDDLPTQAIGTVVLDPSDERVIYAGSGEGHNAYHSYYGLGLFRSVDRGHSWETLGAETFSGRAISKIVVAPDDPDEIWVTLTPAGGSPGAYEAAKRHPDRAGPVGLYHSIDRGASWAQVTAGLPAIPASDVEIDPADPNVIQVVLGDTYGDFANGVYRSVDRGATFQPTLTSFSNQVGFGRSELAIAPSDPSRAYLLVARQRYGWLGVNWGGFVPIGGNNLGLYRSDSGGTAWPHFFNPGSFQGSQGNYDAAVAVHPSDPDTVFLGGVAMLRSEDAGATWIDVTPPHPDVHQIAFDAAGRLLAATDGGVYRSEDLGDSWVPRNRHLGTVQLYAGLSVDSSARGAILGGTQDNGSILASGSGNHWHMVQGGDGGYTAIDPIDPDVLYVEFQFPGNLFRSDDAGLSFQQVGTGIDTIFDVTAFQAPFQIDPSNPGRMLYATQRVYESFDRGDTWTPISGDLTAGDPNTDLYAIRSLAIAPSDGSTVYATTNNQRLLTSADGGTTWTLGRGDAYGWARVQRQIAVDPLDPTHAWVAIGGFGGESLLATTDRGATWAEVGAGLPDLPVDAVAVYRAGVGRVILAGTDRGVWASADDGATWKEYGRGLPAAPVSDLVVDPARNRLIAATFGRGVWVAPLVD